MTLSERKSESLKADLDALRQSHDEVLTAPPLAWNEERAAKLQVLELMAKEAAPPDWEAGSDFEPDYGSNSLQWWTRSQRIRTLGEIPFEVALLEVAERPVYQRIAEEALRLHRLSMSDAAIARCMGVDAKTIGKAIRWRG